MNVLNTVALFERDLLIERTQSDLKRAKSEGKALVSLIWRFMRTKRRARCTFTKVVDK